MPDGMLPKEIFFADKAGIQIGECRVDGRGNLSDDHTPGGDARIGGKQIDRDGEQINAPHPGALLHQLTGGRYAGTV